MNETSALKNRQLKKIIKLIKKYITFQRLHREREPNKAYRKNIKITEDITAKRFIRKKVNS